MHISNLSSQPFSPASPKLNLLVYLVSCWANWLPAPVVGKRKRRFLLTLNIVGKLPCPKSAVPSSLGFPTRQPWIQILVWIPFHPHLRNLQVGNARLRSPRKKRFSERSCVLRCNSNSVYVRIVKLVKAKGIAPAIECVDWMFWTTTSLESPSQKGTVSHNLHSICWDQPWCWTWCGLERAAGRVWERDVKGC